MWNGSSVSAKKPAAKVAHQPEIKGNVLQYRSNAMINKKNNSDAMKVATAANKLNWDMPRNNPNRKTSKAIVEERSRRSGFKSLGELLHINGIGKKLYRKITSYLTLKNRCGKVIHPVGA